MMAAALDKTVAPPAPAATIKLSMPEVSALTTRAARGAGYAWGMADECGFASVWLAEHGFDWTPVLLRRLRGGLGADAIPAPGAWASDGPVCALCAGATFSDFATLPEGPGDTGITLGVLHDPLLVLPFVARVAGALSTSFDCLLDGRPWAYASPGAIVLLDPGLCDQALGQAEVRMATQDARLAKPLTRRSTTTVQRASYAQLGEIALRMTVPATAASETRAGGEGSDND